MGLSLVLLISAVISCLSLMLLKTNVFPETFINLLTPWTAGDLIQCHSFKTAEPRKLATIYQTQWNLSRGSWDKTIDQSILIFVVKPACSYFRV